MSIIAEALKKAQESSKKLQKTSAGIENRFLAIKTVFNGAQSLNLKMVSFKKVIVVLFLVLGIIVVFALNKNSTPAW